MRRWISTLLTALMLANLASWPSFVLAEVLEHEVKAVQLGGQDQPVEPSPVHCKHGCVGHLSQHFQFQTGAVSIEPRRTVSDDVSIEPDVVCSKHFPVLPFRPPLSAPILS
jgi:hypothetical protein